MRLTATFGIKGGKNHASARRRARAVNPTLWGEPAGPGGRGVGGSDVAGKDLSGGCGFHPPGGGIRTRRRAGGGAVKAFGSRWCFLRSLQSSRRSFWAACAVCVTFP